MNRRKDTVYARLMEQLQGPVCGCAARCLEFQKKNRTFSRQQLDILAERLCKCDKDASDSMLDTAPYI